MLQLLLAQLGVGLVEQCRRDERLPRGNDRLPQVPHGGAPHVRGLADIRQHLTPVLRLLREFLAHLLGRRDRLLRLLQGRGLGRDACALDVVDALQELVGVSGLLPGEHVRGLRRRQEERPLGREGHVGLRHLVEDVLRELELEGLHLVGRVLQAHEAAVDVELLDVVGLAERHHQLQLGASLLPHLRVPVLDDLRGPLDEGLRRPRQAGLDHGGLELGHVRLERLHDLLELLDDLLEDVPGRDGLLTEGRAEALGDARPGLVQDRGQLVGVALDGPERTVQAVLGDAHVRDGLDVRHDELQPPEVALQRPGGDLGDPRLAREVVQRPLGLPDPASRDLDVHVQAVRVLALLHRLELVRPEHEADLQPPCPQEVHLLLDEEAVVRAAHGALQHLVVPALHGLLQDLVDLLLPAQLLQVLRGRLEQRPLDVGVPGDREGLLEEVLVVVLHRQLQVHGGLPEPLRLPLLERLARLLEVLGLDALLGDLRDGAAQEVARAGLPGVVGRCAADGVQESALGAERHVVLLPLLQECGALLDQGVVERQPGAGDGLPHALLLLRARPGLGPVLDVGPELPHRRVELVLEGVLRVLLLPLQHFHAAGLDLRQHHPEGLGRVQGLGQGLLVLLRVLGRHLHLPQSVEPLVRLLQPGHHLLCLGQLELHLLLVRLGVLHELPEQPQVVRRLVGAHVLAHHPLHPELHLVAHDLVDAQHQVVALPDARPAPLPELEQSGRPLQQLLPHGGVLHRVRCLGEHVDGRVELLVVLGPVGHGLPQHDQRGLVGDALLRGDLPVAQTASEPLGPRLGRDGLGQGQVSRVPPALPVVAAARAGAAARVAAARLGAARVLGRGRRRVLCEGVGYPLHQVQAALGLLQRVRKLELALRRVRARDLDGLAEGHLQRPGLRAAQGRLQSRLLLGEQRVPLNLFNGPRRVAVELEVQGESLLRVLAHLLAAGAALQHETQPHGGTQDLLHHRLGAPGAVGAHEQIAQAQGLWHGPAVDEHAGPFGLPLVPLGELRAGLDALHEEGGFARRAEVKAFHVARDLQLQQQLSARAGQVARSSRELDGSAGPRHELRRHGTPRAARPVVDDRLRDAEVPGFVDEGEGAGHCPWPRELGERGPARRRQDGHAARVQLVGVEAVDDVGGLQVGVHHAHVRAEDVHLLRVVGAPVDGVPQLVIEVEDGDHPAVDAVAVLGLRVLLVGVRPVDDELLLGVPDLNTRGRRRRRAQHAPRHHEHHRPPVHVRHDAADGVLRLVAVLPANLRVVEGPEAVHANQPVALVHGQVRAPAQPLPAVPARQGCTLGRLVDQPVAVVAVGRVLPGQAPGHPRARPHQDHAECGDELLDGLPVLLEADGLLELREARRRGRGSLARTDAGDVPLEADLWQPRLRGGLDELRLGDCLCNQLLARALLGPHSGVGPADLLLAELGLRTEVREEAGLRLAHHRRRVELGLHGLPAERRRRGPGRVSAHPVELVGAQRPPFAARAVEVRQRPHLVAVPHEHVRGASLAIDVGPVAPLRGSHVGPIRRLMAGALNGELQHGCP
mmetsp:Transcript_74662/g.161474  ORF Transcript_74662/g.161474 Transcript_74662/m.161474 type:complete len:1540 (-) Transcript_74662:16-4635(-)